MDLGLKGRVAIVTGAAGGIGGECARILAAEGCRVVVSDVTEEGLQTLALENPDSFFPVVADLALPDGPAEIVRKAVGEFARLDIAICAGGVFGRARGGMFAGDEGASFISAEAWDHTLNVNLRGTFLLCQEAIPQMARGGWGRIVVIASVSGQMGGFGAGADYAASKAALGGMARSMALTAGPGGVTVNVINPGMILTPMLTDNHDESRSRLIAERSAMRRLGKPSEVASMIAMLASEQAGFITGSHLDINGGFYFG